LFYPNQSSNEELSGEPEYLCEQDSDCGREFQEDRCGYKTLQECRDNGGKWQIFGCAGMGCTAPTSFCECPSKCVSNECILIAVISEDILYIFDHLNYSEMLKVEIIFNTGIGDADLIRSEVLSELNNNEFKLTEEKESQNKIGGMLSRNGLEKLRYDKRISNVNLAIGDNGIITTESGIYMNISLPFSDYSIDLDDNGLIDYLTIEFEINDLSDGEEYSISASLSGGSEEYIGPINGEFTYYENSRIVQINFSGFDIRSRSIEGKLKMGNVIIRGDNTLVYVRNYTHNTKEYGINDFEPHVSVVSCRGLENNLVYVLKNDINVKGDCFSFGRNITFDLNGHSIIGDGSGIGISNGFLDSGSIIKNGVISNFSKGIELKNSNGNVITDLSIYLNRGDKINRGQGIYLSRSNDNLISRNIIYSNDGNAIELDGSDLNTISYNTLNNGFYGGVRFFTSHNNSLIGNVVNNNSYMGVYLNQAWGNLVLNNTINGNNLWGIYIDIDGEEKNVIEGNIILLNRKGDIRRE